ncbi:MAG: hypothetical protein JSY10_05870 [Paenibacillus sp.]|nr:hypothetical protein [Paenibacillus sp.]
MVQPGTKFLLLFVGESGLGKTTFVNTLFSTTIKNFKSPEKRHNKQLDKTVEIEITKAGKKKGQ